MPGRRLLANHGGLSLSLDDVIEAAVVVPEDLLLADKLDCEFDPLQLPVCVQAGAAARLYREGCDELVRPAVA